MNIEKSPAIERALRDLLDVCLYSGTRDKGIAKVMDENRNFMLALLEKPEERRNAYPYSWIAEIVEENALFFDNLLAALRITFPDAGRRAHCDWPIKPWPGQDYGGRLIHFDVNAPTDQRACLFRVLQVCKQLFALMMNNRCLMVFLMNHPDVMNQWVKSWLEEIDCFFVDVQHALSLPDPPEGTLRPWPGDQWDHDSCLMTVKSRRVLQALWRTEQGRKEEIFQPHESEAR